MDAANVLRRAIKRDGNKVIELVLAKEVTTRNRIKGYTLYHLSGGAIVRREKFTDEDVADRAWQSSSAGMEVLA